MTKLSKLEQHEMKERHENTHFGFWVYLMSDCILFATVFAAFLVLRHNVVDGPSAAEIFEMPWVLAQTILLLASSLTSALALFWAKQKHLRTSVIFLVLTGALGAMFMALEIREFAHIINQGYDWTTSAFLSSFFVLVGLHGVHITVGLLWLVAMVVVMLRRGLTDGVLHRLSIFTLFWHFLDIVWIFIFAVVYLMGVGL